MKNRPIKTQVSDSSVAEFLADIENEAARDDAERLIKIMQAVTRHKPAMWGPNIIGFDQYHYKYASGREGEMAAAGFSPRTSNLAIYFVDGLSKYSDLLAKLGPHKTGKACLYIKRLDDVNLNILEELIKKSYAYIKSRDGTMHRAT